MSDLNVMDDADNDMLLLHTAMVSLASIDAETDVLHRLTDTSETVADMIDVVPTMESANEYELYLLQQSAYIASAGSDLTAKDITRPLGRYRGKRVSMEGFKAFLSGIWQTILTAIQRVWRATAKFFKAVFGLIPRLRLSMMLIRKRLKDRPQFDDKRPLKYKVGSEVYCLATKNKAPKSPEKLTETLMTLNEHADFYYGEFLTVAKSVYDDVVTGIERFDEGNEESNLNMISADAIQLAQRNVPPLYKLEPARDSRFTDEYWQCPPLPNNMSVFVRRVPIPQTDDALGRANAIMQNHVTIQPTKDEPSDEEWKEREFITPNARTIAMWLEQVELLLDKAEDFQKSLSEIDGLRDRLIVVTEDLIESLEELNASQANAMPYFRCAIRYNSYLSTAFIHPCGQLTNILFSACRATVVMIQKAVKSIEPVIAT